MKYEDRLEPSVWEAYLNNSLEEEKSSWRFNPNAVRGYIQRYDLDRLLFEEIHETMDELLDDILKLTCEPVEYRRSITAGKTTFELKGREVRRIT